MQKDTNPSTLWPCLLIQKHRRRMKKGSQMKVIKHRRLCVLICDNNSVTSSERSLREVASGTVGMTQMDKSAAMIYNDAIGLYLCSFISL